MTTTSQTQPHPHVKVVFRPATDHGQLQKIAELVLARTTDAERRAS